MARTFFITGATGVQGGVVVRSLLEIARSQNTSFTIHALVRNPASDSAAALSALSPDIKLYKGDWEDTAALVAAAKDCDGAFVVSLPSFTDPEAEQRQTGNIISAAKAAGIKRIIASTVSILNKTDILDNLDRPYPWMTPYLKSKKAIETQTIAAGFPEWTILRPATFFSNFIAPMTELAYPELKQGVLRTGLDPTMKISLLDPLDIGRVAARIFTDDIYAAKYNGAFIPLASINLTYPEIAERLTKSLGGRKEVKLVTVPEAETRKQADEGNIWADTWLFQNTYRALVDVEEVKKLDVPLGSWEDFFERERAKLEAAVGL